VILQDNLTAWPVLLKRRRISYLCVFMAADELPMLKMFDHSHEPMSSSQKQTAPSI
jgi:hypothetical protein